MPVTSFCRGWLIEWLDGRWVWDDTLQSVDDERPCKRCGRKPTPEGYDACLGFIPGAMSACCGHGASEPYVIYEGGDVQMDTGTNRDRFGYEIPGPMPKPGDASDENTQSENDMELCRRMQAVQRMACELSNAIDIETLIDRIIEQRAELWRQLADR